MAFKIRARLLIGVSSLIVGCTHISPSSAPKKTELHSQQSFPADRLVRIVPASLNPLLTYTDTTLQGYAVALNTPHFLLTVAHTVSGSQAVKFMDSNENEYIAKQIRFHPALDLAVVELTDAFNVSPNRLFQNTGMLHEIMIVTSITRSGNTLHIITGAIGEKNDSASTFTTTLPLVPGMSGGPVVDKQGHLIGLNKARLNTQESEVLWLTEDVWKRIDETAGIKN